MRRSFSTCEGARALEQAAQRGLSIPERKDRLGHAFAELCGSTHFTGAQLLLLVCLNGRASASAAHLQMLHVYNPESQVGAQMSARSQ